MSLKFTHNSFSLSITHTHARGAVLIIFLLFFTLQIGAQGFTSTSPYRAEKKVITDQSAQVDEYQSYKSTIYDPFSLSVSSNSNNDQSSGTSGNSNTINTGGFGTESDPNTSNQSPIGEPWIMLLFAAAAAVTVAWRKRKVT